MIDAHASGLRFGPIRRVVEDVFLDGPVRYIRTRGILPRRRLRRQPVYVDGLIPGTTAVNRQGHMALARLPADVLEDVVGLTPKDHPRDQHSEPLKRPGRRHGVDDLTGRHPVGCRVLDVHEGARPRDSDRLRDRAHPQLNVDGRGEPAGQLDPLADEHVEPGERESDAIRAGP